jgi:hypothetical protein
VIAKGLQPFRKFTSAPITTWLNKPIHQQPSVNVAPSGGHLNTGGRQSGYLDVPSKAHSAPEILGVIPERKNEEI